MLEQPSIIIHSRTNEPSLPACDRTASVRLEICKTFKKIHHPFILNYYSRQVAVSPFQRFVFEIA